MVTMDVILAVLIRPVLWPTAVGTVLALAPRRWWVRRPFLPIPDRDFVAWRVTTAYGHPDMTLVADDVVSYLQWRRRNRP
ncbi:MAG: hypothetical protein BMS9Abin12_1991 [Acidimicrobiia bacterium]|nr:MAG: hypothetical protein BMS9Abin12_1991 [Acidimicrobiia bacterium]